jgi:glycosyltransferase involved in cell wall biosynthesis
MATLRRLRSVAGAHEIILVDDGSVPPVDAAIARGGRLLRTPGLGLASARNVGLDAATGEIVCFTDDDCEPDPGWADAAIAFMREHPEHSGVQGPVLSEPWDPLRAHSLAYARPAPGRYYGANIAYRRELLVREAGFSDRLNPYHGEDLDMAFRMLRHGPIGWEPAMRVAHKTKALTFAQIVGRGRFAPHEVYLHERYAEHFGRAQRLPHRLFPFVNVAWTWLGVLKAEWPGILRRPARLARLVGLAVGQSLAAARALVRT